MRTTTVDAGVPATAQDELDAAVGGLPASHRRALDTRLRLLLAALDAPVERGTAPADVVRRATDRIDPDDRAVAWLTTAVVAMRLPTQHEVLRVSRAGVLDGPAATLAAAIALIDLPREPRPIRVVRGAIVIDVHNTARTTFFTGIQRVARECARAWVDQHENVLPIGWADDLLCPQDLPADRLARLLGQEGPQEDVAETGTETATPSLVVPWQCRYLIPELAAERPRTDRLLAMASFTGIEIGSIGYDLVPLTSAETAISGLPNEFAGHLAASRHYQRIATISDAAGDEYRGWRTMISGAGFTGPDIVTVALAAEAQVPGPADLALARDRMMVADLPLVLCVGSHEPRKNHLAVLHAAELLWRRGLSFALTFVGGNSWNSDEFHQTIAGLQALNRPVATLSGIADSTLWAAYQLARFTVFPSLNEGFGLPVVESLMSGTPVITSNYGSTREIAEQGGGVLLVDPRDDDALAEAMTTLLTDQDLLEALMAQAGTRSTRTWAAYAADTWAYLVDGIEPARG
ncbi:MAG TPA: glycosyltransferase family 1 protein [Cellulomonas sp.]